MLNIPAVAYSAIPSGIFSALPVFFVQKDITFAARSIDRSDDPVDQGEKGQGVKKV